jgi:hypothetical protein
MSGHNDHYLEEYCEITAQIKEKICINCGSIVQYPRAQGMQHGFHARVRKQEEDRANEACYPPQPPQPPAKLKPGVQPWRPT